MCDALRPTNLAWNPHGFVGLTGPLHALSERIDRRFVDLASRFDAEGQAFGPLLAVRDLRKIDYFSAFPHLVTFPASVDPEEGNVREFALRNGAEATGPLETPRNAPIHSVLAPAACYAVYIALEGTELSAASRAVTVRGTCFRSETRFEPMTRQPSFSMREIVHLGNAASAKAFLEESREQVTAIAAEWGLDASLAVATDPFFDPARSPKYVHARLFPSKHELVDRGIALASLNNHRNFFGQAYRITRGGEPIHTACVAFGIERWVAAVLRQHGPDPRAWPVEMPRLKQERPCGA
jgi:seryl-tRNA synthetase